MTAFTATDTVRGRDYQITITTDHPAAVTLAIFIFIIAIFRQARRRAAARLVVAAFSRFTPCFSY